MRGATNRFRSTWCQMRRYSTSTCACLSAYRMLKDEGRDQEVPVRLVPDEVGNAVQLPVPVAACLTCRMLKDEGRNQEVPVRLVPGEVGNAVQYQNLWLPV